MHILWQAFGIVVVLLAIGYFAESQEQRGGKAIFPAFPVMHGDKSLRPDAIYPCYSSPHKQLHEQIACGDEAPLRAMQIKIERAVFFSIDPSELKFLVQQAVKEAMGGYTVNVSFVPNGEQAKALPLMPKPLELTDGVAVPVDGKLKPSMLLKAAGPIWLKTRKPFIAANTYERKKHNLNQVSKFFGERTLAQCADADLIREYQDKRRANAGGDCINHECQILSEMLTRVGLWKQVKDDYQPLPVKTSTAGRALSPEEEKLFVAAANSNEDWKVAYWIAVLAAHTLLSPSEIFNRQIRDLDMRNEQLLIPQGKNNFRVREVPLNKHALNCARLLFDRAKELGAWKPDHYLLPYRVRVGEYDPSRPAKSCRSAWRALTRSIGLRGLRPKDMRHHGITVLDETKISPRVTRALAGHSPNSRLLDRYSHPRRAAKKAAVKVLEDKVKLA